jgi:3-methyladenine DNA glycosylase/8-oxoguanine DNA glycosylase
VKPPAPPAGLHGAALALVDGARCDEALARSAGLRERAALERALLRHWHVTPAALRALGRTGRYALVYGGPFHVSQTLRYLARDPHNLAERVHGAEYRRWFPLGTRQVPLRLTLAPDGCAVAVQGAQAPAERLALHGRLLRFLGLDQPLAGFYRAVRADAVMAPLARRLRGVRIPQVPSLWEALCWAVIGQQINLAFAYRLRNRFIALGNGGGHGGGDGNGAAPAAGAGPAPAVGSEVEPLPFPGPEQVLRIPAPAWREAQFSRQKTAYLQGIARAFVEGTLDEDALAAMPVAEAEAALRAVRGLGPWSVAYGLLRALGRVDALPVGDAGLKTALRHHYRLPGPPDARRQEALMEPFRPYRGLATYYFWKSLDALRQE